MQQHDEPPLLGRDAHKTRQPDAGPAIEHRGPGMFEQRPGVFRETANPHVMEKVDDKGNVLGFTITRVSALRDTPLEVAL